MPFNVSWSVVEADSHDTDRVDDPIPSIGCTSRHSVKDRREHAWSLSHR